MQDARSEPRPAEPASIVKETPEPTAKASKETRESAYEKLALNKLTIEREAPEKPAPAPEPELKPHKMEPERRVRVGATSVDVLPGPARKATEPKPPERKASVSEPPRAKLPRFIRQRTRGANRATRACCSRYLGWGSRT
jgi:hypothetical protein